MCTKCTQHIVIIAFIYWDYLYFIAIVIASGAAVTAIDPIRDMEY